MSEEVKLDITSIRSDEVIQSVIDAAEVHQSLKDAFLANFLFDGASLSEWGARMAVVIPDRPTPDDMRALWVSVTKKIQVSGHYHSVASAISSALHSGNSLKKSDVVAAIALSYEKRNKRRPAVQLIEHQADSFMSNTMSAKAAALIVKNFWKQRLDILSEMRKTLEQLGINMNVERKYEQG